MSCFILLPRAQQRVNQKRESLLPVGKTTGLLLLAKSSPTALLSHRRPAPLSVGCRWLWRQCEGVLVNPAEVRDRLLESLLTASVRVELAAELVLTTFLPDKHLFTSWRAGRALKGTSCEALSPQSSPQAAHGAAEFLCARFFFSPEIFVLLLNRRTVLAILAESLPQGSVVAAR